MNNYFIVVQDGDVIGGIKALKDMRSLPMFDYWAQHTTAYKNGIKVYDSKKEAY